MATEKQDDGAVHPLFRHQFSLCVLGYLRTEQQRLMLDIPINLQFLILKFFAFIHQQRIVITYSNCSSDSEDVYRLYRNSILELVERRIPYAPCFTIGTAGNRLVRYRCRRGCPGHQNKLYSWYFQVPNDVRLLHFRAVGLGDGREPGSYASVSEAEREDGRFDGKLTYRTSTPNTTWNGLRFDLRVPQRELIITSWTGIVDLTPSKTIRFDVDTAHDATHSYGIDIVLKGPHSSYTVSDFAMSLVSAQ